jgi:23S rRNA (cytosine1962-C5)-methyltransferase
VLDDFRDAWILFEDEQLIVVHKEAGIAAQAVDEVDHDDLVSRLARHLARRDGCAPEQVYLGVHQRLDRDTSGAVLFTKQREANPAIARQFEGRTVEKTYVAVVDGLPKDAPGRELRQHLVRDRDGRMRVTTANDKRGRLAVTRVITARRREGRALVELGCDTGRTHQLRVQLAGIGAPIAGDALYGNAPALRLMLHAWRLGLRHPVDDRSLQIEDPLPIELEAHLQRGLAFPQGALFERALELAAERRFGLFRAASAPEPSTAFRYLHLDADGVPGLSVDVYDRFLVAGVYDAALLATQDSWLDALMARGFAGIYLKVHPRQKNEVGAGALAELTPVTPARGEPAPETLVIHEHGVPYRVWLADGLRTGLFLDQRDNRHEVRQRASGRRVLNLFAYTCGFSVAALAGGAREVVSVDSSGRALERGELNVAALGASERHRTWRGDAFQALERLAKKGETFDAVIVDPPSYSTGGSGRFVLKRDYAALCEAALRVTAPGGWLLCCVNHHGLGQQWLRRSVHAAAAGLGVALDSVRDLPTPQDFPALPGQEPLAKAVLVTRAG